MDQFAIEELLPRAHGSIYGLVRMAALRALELADGKKPMVDCSDTDKLATIALREIAAEKVELLKDQ